MDNHNKIPEYLEWLTIAEDDLELARIILKEGRCIPPAIFHTQQCAEKALKAYLTYMQQRAPKIHDLIELVAMCQEHDASFASLIKLAASLNPFITSSRYPNIYCIPSQITLKISIDEAQEILNVVKDCIDRLERKRGA